MIERLGKLKAGRYVFTIYDSQGNGICCSHGDGKYTLKVGDFEIHSGGDFESEETIVFDITNSSVDHTQLIRFS